MAVKMRPTYCRTKRPRGALLQLGIGLDLSTVENRRELAKSFGTARATVKYLSLVDLILTYKPWRRAWEQCLVGSLTGEVACSKVTQACKGRLSPDGNGTGRTKAEAGLTVRLTGQTDAKAGLSDPRSRSGCGTGLTDKSYPGDNRLVAPESSYRRRGSTPR